MPQKKKTTPAPTSQHKTIVFLIIMLMIAIATVFIMGYALRQSAPATSSSDSSQVKKEEKPEPLDDATIATNIQERFDRYLASANGTAEEAARASGLFKRTVTVPVSVYIDTTTDIDPVLCSKEAPEHLSYSEPTRQKETTSVIVTGEYKDKKKNTTISVQADRISGDIAYISCVK